MTRSLAVALAALAFSTAVAGCSGSSSMKKSVEAPSPAEVNGDKPASGSLASDDHTLRRSAVRSVVKGGLGLFLQKVVLDDEPVLKDGRFHGFRIAALRDAPFWRGIDLKPGDVVVRVNGLAIEHPEEALEVFHSLESATELRVFYERDGEPRELKYAIVEDEPQKRADASAP